MASAGAVSAPMHRLTTISHQLRLCAANAGALSAAAGWREDACGVSLSGEPILLYQRLGVRADAHHLLLLVPVAQVEAVVTAVTALALSSTISVAAVHSSWLTDCAYPPDTAPVLRFDDADHPESRYIWRWAGFSAVDTIVELDFTDSGEPAWKTNRAVPARITSVLAATPTLNGLLTGIGAPAGPPSGPQNGLGPIPAYLLSAPDATTMSGELDKLLALKGVSVASPSRSALGVRGASTPLQVAATLAATYGHTLDGPQPRADTGNLAGGVGYVQGVGLSGRLRLAKLAGGTLGIPALAETAKSIADLVEDYTSGDRPLWTEPALLPGSGGPTMAALVWCGELADVTGDMRYVDLLMDAASKYTPRNDSGACPYPADADFRTEDMFFHSAILGRASAITGNLMYIEMATASMTTPTVDTLVRSCFAYRQH